MQNLKNHFMQYFIYFRYNSVLKFIKDFLSQVQIMLYYLYIVIYSPMLLVIIMYKNFENFCKIKY